jgi:hypothetical protein
LRSVRSEIDYKAKKDFTDILGEPSKAQQLNRLRNEHDTTEKKTGEHSYKSSTYKSKVSSKSKISNVNKVLEQIKEEENTHQNEGKNESRMSKLVEELIGTL